MSHEADTPGAVFAAALQRWREALRTDAAPAADQAPRGAVAGAPPDPRPEPDLST